MIGIELAFMIADIKRVSQHFQDFKSDDMLDINGFRTDKVPELYISYPRTEDMFKCLKILIYSH